MVDAQKRQYVMLSLVPTVANVPAQEQRRQRLRATATPDLIQCRCGSREIVESRSGALLISGKVTGGARQWVCLPCLMRGERVVLA